MTWPLLNVVDDVSAQGARRFVALGEEAIADHGGYTVALAGGATPRALYERLQPGDLPWERVALFFGDERVVPKDSSLANYQMVHDSLLARIPAASAHWLHDAAEYEALVKSTLGPSGRFDLVLLGMGDDGHTASLFPGSAALAERERWIVEAPGPPPATLRFTMTPPLIWQARHVIILVSGEKKAQRLAEVVADPGDRYPVAITRRCEGSVEWLVDPAAAKNLP